MSYVHKGEFNWDTRFRLKRGDKPWAQIGMEEEVLQHSARSAWNPELEDTNMLLTPEIEQLTVTLKRMSSSSIPEVTRDVKASDDLFGENAKLFDLRKGLGTYGYCAWCDAPVGSPSGLWNYYDSVHQVSMHVAPRIPPSVWQTLLGRGFPERGSGNKVSQTGRADCIVTFLLRFGFLSRNLLHISGRKVSLGRCKRGCSMSWGHEVSYRESKMQSASCQTGGCEVKGRQTFLFP